MMRGFVTGATIFSAGIGFNFGELPSYAHLLRGETPP